MSIQCPPGSFSYRIVAGDTLYRLAQRFGTTVAVLLAANPGINPNALYIGQQICIPSGGQPIPCPPGSVTYTIRSGDTLYAIAQLYGTTVAAIIAANPGIDPNNLQVGRIICIPLAASPDCAIPLSLSGPAVPSLPPGAGGAGLIQQINADNYAVTLVVRGLPEPAELGNFNEYVGIVQVGGQAFLLNLPRAQAFEQEPTWSGTRTIPVNPLLSSSNALTVAPFNSVTGARGVPVLGGTVSQCQR